MWGRLDEALEFVNIPVSTHYSDIIIKGGGADSWKTLNLEGLIRNHTLRLAETITIRSIIIWLIIDDTKFIIIHPNSQSK